MTEENPDRQWHLDKKVPLPMLLVVGGQTLAIVWWAATTNARLDEVERKLVANAPQAVQIVRLEERAIRNEEKVGILQQGINEIKALLANPRPR